MGCGASRVPRGSTQSTGALGFMQGFRSSGCRLWTPIKGLITLLTKSHDPPSKGAS